MTRSAIRGSVIFQVFADGTKIYDSGDPDRAGRDLPVVVDVSGTDALQLVVTDGGDNKSLRPRRLGRRQADLRERHARRYDPAHGHGCHAGRRGDRGRRHGQPDRHVQ